LKRHNPIWQLGLVSLALAASACDIAAAITHVPFHDSCGLCFANSCRELESWLVDASCLLAAISKTWRESARDHPARAMGGNASLLPFSMCELFCQICPW